jgi:hypothetical protein
MSAVAITNQPELITDDPRRDADASGVFAELQDYFRISRELGGLLTQSQAARILNVATGSISSLVLRGRLSCAMVAGVRMVSASEILALRKERSSEARAVGGRGLKSPSLAELTKAAWEDTLKD